MFDCQVITRIWRDITAMIEKQKHSDCCFNRNSVGVSFFGEYTGLKKKKSLSPVNDFTCFRFIFTLNLARFSFFLSLPTHAALFLVSLSYILSVISDDEQGESCRHELLLDVMLTVPPTHWNPQRRWD